MKVVNLVGEIRAGMESVSRDEGTYNRDHVCHGSTHRTCKKKRSQFVKDI